MTAVKQIFICLLIGTLVAGCNMKDEGKEEDQHGKVNNRNFGGLDVGNSLGNPNVTFMNTSNNTNTNHSGLHIEKEAQERVQNLPEIKQATIIAADRNAYVAVEMDDDFHGEFNSYIEDRIAQRVRDGNANIVNVYISSNRDFVSQMKQYRDNIQNGRATTGFTKMIQRVFVNHQG